MKSVFFQVDFGRLSFSNHCIFLSFLIKIFKRDFYYIYFLTSVKYFRLFFMSGISFYGISLMFHCLSSMYGFFTNIWFSTLWNYRHLLCLNPRRLKVLFIFFFFLNYLFCFIIVLKYKLFDSILKAHSRLIIYLYFHDLDYEKNVDSL